MILWSKHGIRVRKLEEGDADRLVQWLSDPRVLEYYEGRDRPHDMAMVQEHFYRERQIEACIIQLDDRDIGYIQYYPVDPEEREVYGYGEGDGRIFGMDQFIGEPDCWNRGIGTKLIQGMVSYLTNTLQADTIVMDPQTWNTRALRVYEKCGFRKIRLLEKREWHEGEYRDCWLIEYSPADREEKQMNRYSQTLNHLVGYFESELKALPVEEFRQKPGPAKWSKQEIVGHLCDSAVNNHLRFVKIKLSAHPVSLEGYDQERWVDLHGYQEQYTKPDIIMLWVMLNRQIAHVLDTLTVEDYGKACILPGGGEATLDWLVSDYLEHMRHHFRQILGPEPVERAKAGK